ncbi:MAG: HPr family phosphocarrier protein [Gammaproteobacteria bacterium]|nr:HPr family phosphocarrier protein [Gammaproteobacteria bacterium]NNF62444.1 HPr family phosphocarrier protein [Gammaproteobacteria bacterium]NNM21391.1 HPr family phosphocarrier protein [Gammaproteobacteria bacterium]
MLEFDVTVRNQRGLHARPAARVVAMTSEFDSNVRLIYEDRNVDGKSILGLLVLAAPQGARLRVQLDGPDEQRAERRLQALFDSLNKAGIQHQTAE